LEKFNMEEVSSYFNNLVQLMRISKIEISEICTILVNAIRRGNSIWIMGNGGSASTAEHFETDLAYIKKGNSLPKIRATALTSNSALISAIGNDIGFDEIFAQQLNRKASNGDVCVLISASGNSLNLIRAVEVSKKLGLETVAFLGFDGGKILNLVDYSILVSSKIGNYGPVEDVHLAICHSIASRISSVLESKIESS